MYTDMFMQSFASRNRGAGEASNHGEYGRRLELPGSSSGISNAFSSKRRDGKH